MEQSGNGPDDGTPTFLDGADRRWEVHEISEPILPDRSSLLARAEFSAGWLLFTCGVERRRLAPLPPGWRHAPEAQLRRWCDDAAPARKLS
jgi:hypothetical protein